MKKHFLARERERERRLLISTLLSLSLFGISVASYSGFLSLNSSAKNNKEVVFSNNSSEINSQLKRFLQAGDSGGGTGVTKVLGAIGTFFVTIGKGIGNGFYYSGLGIYNGVTYSGKGIGLGLYYTGLGIWKGIEYTGKGIAFPFKKLLGSGTGTQESSSPQGGSR